MLLSPTLSHDLEWLAPATEALKSNDWKSPVWFDGKALSTSQVCEQAAIDLFSALGENTSARTLVIRDVNFGLNVQQALTELLARNHFLESVTLKNLRVQQLTWQVPHQLFDNKSLRQLHLERCLLDATSCRALARLLLSSDASLLSLTLKDVQLDEGCCVANIAMALSKADSLEELCLHGLTLSSENINLLIEAIGMNSSLRTLRLEKMSLDVESAPALGAMLADNQHLTQLSLRNNNLCGDAIRTLVQDGLARNNSLQALCLSQNPVGDNGAECLAKGLMANFTLRKLSLVQAEIWSDGCREFLSGIAKCQGLRHVSLDGNDFDDCVTDLLLTLDQNMFLEHVMDSLPLLMRSKLSDTAAWRQVDLLLRMNKAGRRMLLVDNDFAPSLVPYVLAKGAAAPSSVCHDRGSRPPDVLYEMIRQLQFYGS